MSEYFVVFRDAAPEVQVIDELGKSANVRNGDPESLRHVLQWQCVRLLGSVELEYLI